LEGIEQVPVGGSVRRRLPDSYRPTGLYRHVAGPGFTVDDYPAESRGEKLSLPPIYEHLPPFCDPMSETAISTDDRTKTGQRRSVAVHLSI